jgi:SRSO17 transposase
MARAGQAEVGRFEAYLERLEAVVGHADRQAPLRAYVTGLLLPGERKSVEPMAAKVDPQHVAARHQSMHHFVANAAWDEATVLRVARDYVLPQLERHGPVGAWVVDDTGMPEEGAALGRGRAAILRRAVRGRTTRQVAVTVSPVNAVLSVPAAYRLYLPEALATDRRRRAAAGIPRAVRFQPKWQLALAEIDRLLAEDLPRAPVVTDAGYGVVTAFRDALTARHLSYVAGITGETSVWPPDREPDGPGPYRGRGCPQKRLQRRATNLPVATRALALALAPTRWRAVSWRAGTQGTMRSRFAAVRVRAAHRDYNRSVPRDREWLLIEWPAGEPEPTKYWLSTVPATVPLSELVRVAKIRWRIERDYQELKDEIGLDHYEGRGWEGFHHHGVLCIAAYAFLAAERARLSPPAPLAFLRPARLPKSFRPRGAARAS